MGQCTVMFSGGRDSFVSACRMLDRGYRVHLVTFDNGCMSGLNFVNHGADRLRNRYEDRILCVTALPIAEYFSRIRERIYERETYDIANVYPYLVLNQLNCLMCHSMMYIAGVKYCLSNGVGMIVDGGRISQGFIVEQREMVNRYKSFCQSFGIEVEFPVLNVLDDLLIKEEMSDRGFIPKVLETQCWVGGRLKEELSDSQKMDLLRYFDAELEPFMRKEIG